MTFTNYEINANTVILAVNAAKLKSIHGDVPDKIVKSAQFQQLLGIPVVTVTQWWLKPWWKKAYLGKEINLVLNNADQYLCDFNDELFDRLQMQTNLG